MNARPTAWFLSAVALAAGCQNGEASATAKQVEAIDASISEAKPVSTEAFLAELLPLPEPELYVRYAIASSGPISGWLEVALKPGGFRSERWQLVFEQEGVREEVDGARVETPQWVWTRRGGGPGTKSPSPLAPLLAAWSELEPDTQAAAVASARRWYEELKRARAEHPSDTEEVLGRRCTKTRVAAQDLCLWEEAGLPLWIRGGAFTLQAQSVAYELGDGQAFTIPAGAKASAQGHAKWLIPEPTRALTALAAGDYALMATALAPGARLDALGELREMARRSGAAGDTTGVVAERK